MLAEVLGDHRGVALVGHVEEGREERAARVVDEHVDAAELVDDALDEHVAGVGVADVEQRGERRVHVLRFAVAGRDGGAELRAQLGGRPPDPARRARDDHDLVGQQDRRRVHGATLTAERG